MKMKRFAVLLLIGALLALTAAASAQDATPVPTSTGPTNAVQARFYACTDSVVMTLEGVLLNGYSVFWQAFPGGGATGTPLTSVRQVNATGDFTYAESVANNAGMTTAAGATASAKVTIARTSNPAAVDFEFIVSDANDGCSGSIPTGTVTTSTDSGAGATSSSGASAAHLFAPNGAVLNPNLNAEPEVVVGARQSDRFRSDTPGLIFAECDAYPMALPGIVYDNDNVVVYWSWFTKTREQMDQQLANANYAVKMNGAYFNPVQRSEPELRSGNWWVFYTAPVGNLQPGHYEVDYQLTWSAPVNDGYHDYGPGTDNPVQANTCNFDIRRNPDNGAVSYTGMFNPSTYPVHNITPDY